jgi:hypothetical protein
MREQTWGDVIPPTKYLNYNDVAGREIPVTIARITTEAMPDKSVKPVVFFKEFSRGVVLNATRRKFIQQLTDDSPKIADAIGLELMLVPGRAMFQGQEVGTIKFALRPAAKSKQVKAALDDEIPF